MPAENEKNSLLVLFVIPHKLQMSVQNTTKMEKDLTKA